MTTPAPLDRFLAALLAADAGTAVLERAPDRALLSIGGRTLLLAFEPSEAPAQLETQLRGALDVSQQTGAAVVLLTTSDLRPQILQAMLASPAQPSSAVVCLVRPDGTVEAVNGPPPPTLRAAAARLANGEPLVAPAVEAVRATQLEEAQRFLDLAMRRTPVVTWAIGVTSVAVFALQWAWGNGDPIARAMNMGAAVGSLTRGGEWWRLLAPTVLHGSLLHLVFNMLALFSFGTYLERFIGSHRYLVLYVASGLGGSVLALMRSADAIGVGASGGIWGVMIAGAALVTWPRGLVPALIAESQRTRAWTPVGINLLYSFAPGISMLAHLGGGAVGGLLIVGGAITLGLPKAAEVGPGTPPSKETSGFVSLAWFSGFAVVVSVAVAWLIGRPWDA